MGISNLKLEDIKDPKSFCEKVLGLVWVKGNKNWPPRATSSNSGTLAAGHTFANATTINMSSLPKSTNVDSYDSYCLFLYAHLQEFSNRNFDSEADRDLRYHNLMRSFSWAANNAVKKMSNGTDKNTLNAFIKKLDEWIADLDTARSTSPPRKSRDATLAPAATPAAGPKSKAASPAPGGAAAGKTGSGELAVRCFLTGDEKATDGDHMTFSVPEYALVGTLKYEISKKVPSSVLVKSLKSIKIFKDAASRLALRSAQSLQPILVKSPNIIMKAVIPGYEPKETDTSNAVDSSGTQVYQYTIDAEKKVYKVCLAATATVKDLKEYLQEQHGSSNIANIRVLFAGKDLGNTIVLADLKIRNNILNIHIKSEQDILLMTAKALRLDQPDSNSKDDE